jgi:hypothetical protein
VAYIDTLGDIARVSVAVIQDNSQIQINNFHYACTVAGGTDTRQQLGLHVYNLYAALLGTYFSNATKLHGWKVHMLKASQAFSPVTGTSDQLGSGGIVILPTAVRPLIHLQTGLVGKKYNGRLYMATPTGSGVGPGSRVSDTAQASLNTLMTGLLPPFFQTGTTWTYGLLHRAKGPPVVLTTTPITAFVVTPKWGTQHKSGDFGRTNAIPW